MVEIRIDNTGDGTWWLYNDNDVWKDYCGCDNFDEQVVLTGNRHCKEYKDAKWYQAAKDILNDIDCNCNYDIYDCSDGKQYGDGAELIFCTQRDGFNKPLDRILDMKIKSITTQDSTIVIEAAK